MILLSIILCSNQEFKVLEISRVFVKSRDYGERKLVAKRNMSR